MHIPRAATSLLGLIFGDDGPTVDLGYATYGASYNASGEFYTFNNIRYADPQVRFAKPEPPTADGVGSTLSGVFNDTSSIYCPQAYPEWILEPQAEAAGLTVDELELLLYASTPVTEDCLFLDVSVPSTILDNAENKSYPVLVWIYGGGFTTGSKTDFNPSGLIAEAQVDDQEGIVFVKINYRLGIFGWLGSGDGITPNLGLWDQKQSLEWVQEYIQLFGGDPDRVTVMGESAGGASIMHQITAFGGSEGPVPFSQAIPQSPAFQIGIDPDSTLDLAFEAASNVTGMSITTVEQLEDLSSMTMIEVNKAAIQGAIMGSFAYGPVVNGDFVPDLPGVLLADDRFDQSVQIMVGHNSDEAEDFVTKDVYSNADIRALLEETLPILSNATINTILTEIYPDDLSGAYPYTTEAERWKLMNADSCFTCNAGYLMRAFSGSDASDNGGKPVFGYQFGYPPGVHGEDIQFTFFYGDVDDTSVTGVPVDAELATTMQQYFTRFTESGDPNTPAGLMEWPSYPTLLQFNSTIVTMDDPTANSRCDYWQSGEWRY